MDLITSNTVEPQAIKPTNFWGDTWKRVKRDRNALLGMIMLSIIISSIVFLPLVYTTPGETIDFTISTVPPSWQHPFGTNDLGQDQLARLLQGGRVSLTVGISAMVVAIFLGTLVGAIAGFYGGVIDGVLMRITDIFLSLPQLPLLLLIIYLFRDSIIVAATLSVGNGILTESTLSFLGLGFPPDIPTWGRMLFEAKDYIASAPYMALFPGLAIFLTVLSINYIGDGLTSNS